MHIALRSKKSPALSILAIALVSLFASSTNAVANQPTTFNCPGGGNYQVDGNGILTQSQNCNGNLVIDSSVKAISDDALRNNGLVSVIIPNSVITIGIAAFYGDTNLISVQFSDSLTSIGSQAFQATGLTSIVVPNSVINIGANAFASVPLRSVTPNSHTKKS